MIFEAGPLVVSVAGKEKPDVMTALNFWISGDGRDQMGRGVGQFVGNVKATPPNAIVSKISNDMAANKIGALPALVGVGSGRHPGRARWPR